MERVLLKQRQFSKVMISKHYYLPIYTFGNSYVHYFGLSCHYSLVLGVTN